MLRIKAGVGGTLIIISSGEGIFQRTRAEIQLDPSPVFEVTLNVCSVHGTIVSNRQPSRSCLNG